MPLFIDRLPLEVVLDPLTRHEWLAVALPILVANPGLPQPPVTARPQRWLVDTRFTGEAFAWRHHLEEAGLDVSVRLRTEVALAPLLSAPKRYPARMADLWLVSNLAGLQAIPYPMRLHRGIAFHNVQRLPDPETNAPLLGMRALANARLTLKIDCVRRTLTVWTPGSWLGGVAVWARRLAGGWRREAPW
jgi:hypothetical protein